MKNKERKQRGKERNGSDLANNKNRQLSQSLLGRKKKRRKQIHLPAANLPFSHRGQNPPPPLPQQIKRAKSVPSESAESNRATKKKRPPSIKAAGCEN